VRLNKKLTQGTLFFNVPRAFDTRMNFLPGCDNVVADKVRFHFLPAMARESLPRFE
jgi:hypothetical protein